MPDVVTIQSGKDIFKVGEVLQTGYGTVRVVSKRIFPDYVVYTVEQQERKILSPFTAPVRFPYLQQAAEKIRALLH